MSGHETQDSDTWVKATDILGPAATLLGLVLAAIGFSASIPGISTILRPVSLALVLVVILFAGAALVACVASLQKSHIVLRAAIALFAMGWISLGVVVSLFLLGYAWGIQIFQIKIPQIAWLDVAQVLFGVLGIATAVVQLLIYANVRRRRRSQG